MLYIVTAFKTEATPFIQHLDLHILDNTHSFPMFEGPGSALIISGPGKSKSAAATDYLHAVYDKKESGVWLNFGIAGHAELPLGQIVLAKRITNRSDNQSWQTVQTFEHKLQCADLLTVDTPESDYDMPALYDMEAAGFYTRAITYTAPHLVQCIKLVSDNRNCPLERFTIKLAAKLIHEATPVLCDFLDSLRKDIVNNTN